MPAPPQSHPALVCDGCGRAADSEHLRNRILRLELRTRFRPIHIGTLLLTDAPPGLREDCFYFTGPSGRARAAWACALLDDVLEAAGLSGEGENDAARLAEFERCGFFLAECVECPVELGAAENFALLLDRLAPSIVRRIQFSYKPRRILLLSAPTAPMIPVFKAAGLGDLLLDSSGPLPLPEPSDSAARASFRAQLAQLLAGSASPRP